jgi:hypothetical protein
MNAQAIVASAVFSCDDPGRWQPLPWLSMPSSLPSALTSLPSALPASSTATQPAGRTPTVNDRLAELVRGVKDHALANYENYGWGYIVEPYTDKELADELKHCRTPAGAIRKMHDIATLLDGRRRDIQSTEW